MLFGIKFNMKKTNGEKHLMDDRSGLFVAQINHHNHFSCYILLHFGHIILHMLLIILPLEWVEN